MLPLWKLHFLEKLWREPQRSHLPGKFQEMLQSKRNDTKRPKNISSTVLSRGCADRCDVSQSRSQSLRFLWVAVGKREPWEQPFQACAIDADCAVKTGWAEFGYFHCYFKMIAPRALVLRPLVKGNETLGTRLVRALKDDYMRGILNILRLAHKIPFFRSCNIVHFDLPHGYIVALSLFGSCPPLSPLVHV